MLNHSGVHVFGSSETRIRIGNIEKSETNFTFMRMIPRVCFCSFAEVVVSIKELKSRISLYVSAMHRKWIPDFEIDKQKLLIFK